MGDLPVGKKPTAFTVLRYFGRKAFFARNQPPSEADFQAAASLEGQKEELRYLKRLAAQGHARSQHLLGIKYDFGKGVRENKRLGGVLYRLAADGGDAAAMFDLGCSYHLGDGAPVDIDLAMEWYRKAAEAGEARGMNNLATILGYGTDAQKDVEAAKMWSRRSAEAGNPRGMFNLAHFLEQEDKDNPEVESWLRRSAEAGFEDAKARVEKLDLANAKAEGDEAAFNWLKERADERDFFAMTELARLYEDGTFVEQSVTQAYALLTSAVAHYAEREPPGMADVLNRIIDLHERMSADELANGRQSILDDYGVSALIVVGRVFRQFAEAFPDLEPGRPWFDLALANGASPYGFAGGRMYSIID